MLDEEVGSIGPFERAKTPKRLPVVLSKSEVRALFESMRGTRKLVASLLYGSGLRVTEALRLRIKDLDFDRNQLFVRQGKGAKVSRNHAPRHTARHTKTEAGEDQGTKTARPKIAGPTMKCSFNRLRMRCYGRAVPSE